MERYRIFLSSPSDVLIERDRAEAVVKRVNARRIDQPQLELVRWELEYYSAGADFQAQIPQPSDCQLVVCIFWKRLGTDLPDKYARSDGTLPTGTEYEFEEALKAAAARAEKLPDVLVYRKTAEVTFSVDTLDFERAQYDRFMGFWRRWFRNEKGHFLAAFQSFATPDEFESVFERNLEAWLRDRETQVSWTQGSPYRGLEPFDVEHAAIFFGRRREVERARARLIASAAGGKPFLLIIGASGAGKSSLARAGLIPRLAQLGGLSTLAAALRWTIFTPGQIAGGWASGLAARLFDKAALGDELRAGDFNQDPALASQFARADASACAPLVGALRRAGEKMAIAERREHAPKLALLILIDQLEELFAWPADQATTFLGLLQELCRLPDMPVLIVATMRSDFQHRLAEFPVLAALAGRTDIKGPFEGEQTLELGLPSSSDLREMILSPAGAAGLVFEVNGERDLAQLIEAEARPEAMPNVQFLLTELYAARTGKMLTLAAFDALGGVDGVMAKRGEDVHGAADQPARDAFPRIVRALVTQVRSDVPASTRRVPERAFADDAPAARLIGALREARLIISDRGELRFTHDSLLTGWTRLKDQIAEEQRLFAARERLEQYCARWVEASADRLRGKFLLEGFPLAEGRELLAKWGAAALSDKQPELPAFIKASDRREKRARRVSQAIGWSVAAVFAVFSVLLFQLWQSTERAQKATQASLWIAQSQASLRDGNIVAALDPAARAYAAVPTDRSRSNLLAALLEVSPHLAAVTDLGRETSTALAWTDDATLVFASGTGRLRAIAGLPGGARPGQTWMLPNRPQGTGATIVRALRAVAAGQLVAVFGDGSIGLLRPGTNIALPYAGAEAVSLDPLPHAVAIGARGQIIATARDDDEITLHRCDWTRAGIPCDAQPLGSARGRAVAVSPDGTRVAVGDRAGMVTLYDGTGKRVREPEPVGGPIAALDWASQRDWIAAGTIDGAIVVFDAGAQPGSVIAREQFGDRPVTALAWSPTAPSLAFVCSLKSVCLWRSEDEDKTPHFRPAIRLEGHENAVTRLAWSPTGRHLASGGTDGTIRTWDLVPNTEASYALYADAPAELSTVAATMDGERVAAAGKDGTIRVWTSPSTDPSRTIRPRSISEVSALAWSRNGGIAALHEDSTLSVVSDDVQPHPVALKQLQPGSRLAWADDGSLLAVPLRDGRIALLRTDQSVARQPRFLVPDSAEHAASGAAVDLGRGTLFTSDTRGDISLWDLATGKREPMRDMREDRVKNVAAGSLSVSADGQWLATSGADRFVPIYDVAKRTSSLSLEIERGETVTVAFSPNGRRFAALGSDNRLYVWNYSGGTASPFLSVTIAAGRPAVGNSPQREERASWMAWVGDDRLAVATGGAAITVIQLDPEQWRRRVGAISPRPAED